MKIDLVAPLEDCVHDAIDIDLLRPRWMRNAACRGEGFGAWFPKDEMGEAAAVARQVCAGCPVRADCLEYALAGRIRYGLWGGLSGRQRSALTRRRVS